MIYAGRIAQGISRVKKARSFPSAIATIWIGGRSTKLPNLMVTIPFRIPVTTSEYLNQHK
jgi:hypothetical protein